MNEQTVVFGPEQHLVGTITHPAQPKPGRAGVMVLLTNAGVIPRIGPHRLNVKLARHFAQMGVASLRFDMSGLGDSRRSGSRRSTGDQFVADTIAAMDLAKQQFGCTQFIMVGFCSGADVAHLTALDDARLRAIVMWDSYVYPNTKAKLFGFIHRARRHGLHAAFVKALRFVRAASKNRNESAAAGQPAEGPVIFGRSRMPPRDEFGKNIRTLVDRGVELHFVYSGGEPDWYNYERQFHDMFEPYGFVDRVAYTYLTQSDHTLTQPKAQDAFIQCVDGWLEQRAWPALEKARTTAAQSASPPALQAA
jgi:alpha/beta superfamily hydrolase